MMAVIRVQSHAARPAFAKPGPWRPWLTEKIALERKIRDFEDAVIEAVALDSEAAVIATRNLLDFKHSRVLAQEPHEIRW